MKRARGHWPCDSTYAPRGRTGVDRPHQYPSQVSAHHRQLESRGPPADAGVATPLNRSCYGLASVWIKRGHQALTPKCPDQQEKEDAAYPRLYHGWFCMSRKKFCFSSFPPHFFLTAWIPRIDNVRQCAFQSSPGPKTGCIETQAVADAEGGENA